MNILQCTGTEKGTVFISQQSVKVVFNYAKVRTFAISIAVSKVKSMYDHEMADLHSQPTTLPSINFLQLTVSEM